MDPRLLVVGAGGQVLALRAAEADTEAAGRYYLVWPQGTPRPALQVLVKWLEIQVSVDPGRDLDAAAGR